MKQILIAGEVGPAGEALAKRFLDKGWRVGVISDDAPALVNLYEQNPGPLLWTCEVEPSNAEDVRSAISAFARDGGGYLHVLFVNATIAYPGPFERTSAVDHQRVLERNLSLALHAAHAAYRYLRVTPSAHMITMSTLSSLYGVPEYASYAAGRAAVRALTESLTMEWRQYDIRVSDVMPPVLHPGDYVEGGAKPAGLAARLGRRVGPDLLARLVWSRVHDERLPADAASALFQSGQALNRLLPSGVQRFLVRRLSGL